MYPSPYHVPRRRALSGMLTDEQLAAVQVTPDQLLELPDDVRIDLAIRHQDAENERKDRVWIVLRRVSEVVLPLAIAFGFMRSR